MEANLFAALAEDDFGGSGAVRLVPGTDDVLYFPHFLERSQADRYLSAYLEGIDWTQEKIQLYGKIHAVPRLTAWYGDPGASYVYSKIRNEPKPWTKDLLPLLRDVEDAVGAQFNSVLLNRYRSGRDSLSWHADDEPELGDSPVIASVSLGVERTFLLRSKEDRTKIASARLGHGSLLVMRGLSQRTFQHSVPKESRVHGERVNLTFRVVEKGSASGRTLPSDRSAPNSPLSG